MSSYDTYEVITVTIPVREDGISFEDVRQIASDFLGEPIAASTLRDWIVDVCKLRTSNPYSSRYFKEDLEWLIRWLGVRQTSKRYEARDKFDQLLRDAL